MQIAPVRKVTVKRTYRIIPISAWIQVQPIQSPGGCARPNVPLNCMLDDIKKTLWATADKLRANMDAAEYKHLVLGLIFVKYISDIFAARRADVALRLTDPDDEYSYGQAAQEDLDAELEDRDYYREVNIFWVPDAARWEALRVHRHRPVVEGRLGNCPKGVAGIGCARGFS